MTCHAATVIHIYNCSQHFGQRPLDGGRARIFSIYKINGKIYFKKKTAANLPCSR